MKTYNLNLSSTDKLSGSNVNSNFNIDLDVVFTGILVVESFTARNQFTSITLPITPILESYTEVSILTNIPNSNSFDNKLDGQTQVLSIAKPNNIWKDTLDYMNSDVNLKSTGISLNNFNLKHFPLNVRLTDNDFDLIDDRTTWEMKLVLIEK